MPRAGFGVPGVPVPSLPGGLLVGHDDGRRADSGRGDAWWSRLVG